MKVTIRNIIGLWFAADTPIRSYKIKLNPDIWEACLQVNEEFVAPSGAKTPETYRKSDKVKFANAVLQKLNQLEPVEEAV